MKIILLVFCFLSCISISAQEPALDTNNGTQHTKSVESNSRKHSHSNHDHYGDHWEIPSQNPDRIILTFYGNPSSQRAVTWRTDSTIQYAVAQISIVGKNSNIYFENDLVCFLESEIKYWFIEFFINSLNLKINMK